MNGRGVKMGIGNEKIVFFSFFFFISLSKESNEIERVQFFIREKKSRDVEIGEGRNSHGSWNQCLLVYHDVHTYMPVSLVVNPSQVG